LENGLCLVRSGFGLVYGFKYAVDDPAWVASAKPGASDITHVSIQFNNEGMPSFFAFTCAASRDLFEQLITVQGVGPGVALKVISKNGSAILLRVISEGDWDKLTSLPGLTGKNGKDIVAALSAKSKTKSPAKSSKHVDTDAVMALQAMGYKLKDAQDAVRKAQASSPKELDTADLIKLALKKEK